MNEMIDRFHRIHPYLLSILRIIAGLLFIQHGCAKILGIIPTPNQPAFLSLIWFAGLIELVGGALLIIGLKTRFVAFICSGLMAFAYFIGHFPKGFIPLLNQGNLAILYCFVFLYLASAGAGPLSLDSARAKSSAM